MIKRLLIVILLLILPALTVRAENVEVLERKQDCLPFEDSNGEKICTEYDQSCRDDKGRFVKCSENSKNKKIVKRCRSSKSGRFIKCPQEGIK